MFGETTKLGDLVFEFSAGARYIFFFLKSIRTGTGIHSASYSVGIWGPFPEGEAAVARG
jgi:hypothetical protein